MEPKRTAPNMGPEFSPASYEQNPEAKPDLPKFENGIERGAEQFEQRAETTAPPAIPVLPTTVVLPPPVQTDDTTSTSVVSDDTPLIANDDDLIEREWVHKAKKIISDTKDDPYRREQEVGKLQSDYLLKRYGKELGASQ